MPPLIAAPITEFGLPAIEALADALLKRDAPRAMTNAQITAETEAGIAALRKLAGKDPVTGQ